MRLNVQSDFALRLLMHLAVNPGRLSTIAEIADRYAISKNHLMKVANALGRDGFIETVRGRSGGLRLARSAAEIKVGDVVRRTEGDFALVECFQADDGACLITPVCRLKGFLRNAMEVFLSELDRHTIHDLVADNNGLRDLLTEDAA